jgi:hypothetical protein
MQLKTEVNSRLEGLKAILFILMWQSQVTRFLPLVVES